MAKPLVFRLGSADFAFQLNKVDRSKLYGYKDLEVLDEQGRPCELATLAGDGRTVIGKGGAALANLTVDGAWVEKAELTPIDPEGRPIAPVASSYALPVELDATTTVADYLQHNIRLVYQLADEGETAAVRERLRAGAIFKFPYSFRGGLEADAGFLLQNANGEAFLAVGNPTKVEFVGLAQPLVLEEETEGDDADLMDFDMI